MNGRTNIGHQTWPRHVQEIKGGRACGVFQIESCLAAKVANHHVLIDYHGAWSVGAKHDPIRDLLNLRVEVPSLRWRREVDRLQRFDLGKAGVRTEFHLRSTGHDFFCVNLCALVHQLEEIAEHADRFRRTEQQITAGIERVMKDRHRAFLQLRPQIDQNVPATDEIQSREWWIGSDILPSKGAYVAHRAVDLISAVEFFEETLQTLRRNILFDCAGINAQARTFDCRFAQVRAENLDSHGGGGGAECFQNANGQRIDLFAARASRHPNAQLTLAGFALHEVRNELFAESRESALISEEARYVD